MKKIDLAHRRQFARRITYPTGFRANAKGRLKLQTHFEDPSSLPETFHPTYANKHQNKTYRLHCKKD
jgi:hypothetical protein